MASSAVQSAPLHQSPHKRRKSSGDHFGSGSPVLKAKPSITGLGIKGLDSSTGLDVAAHTLPISSESKLLVPAAPADLFASPYIPSHDDPPDTPSPPRSSGPSGETTMDPASPGYVNSYSQYGNSLSKFKAQVKSPTPSPRKANGPKDRPTLMRTPPSDHPISGIQVMSGVEDDDEDQELDEIVETPLERDEKRSSIADLPASPARLAFSRQHGLPGSPSSPTVKYSGNGSPASPTALLHDRFVQSDTTSEHKIHARNLSAFFPRPGQAPAPHSPGSPRTSQSIDAPITDIPSKTSNKVRNQPRSPAGASSMNGWTFGAPRREAKDALGVPPSSPLVNASVSSLAPPPSPGRVGRRGHHHKHSLSHNFFSFLDPTVTNPNLANGNAAGPASDVESTIPPPSATPKPVPTTFIQGSFAETPASVASPLLPYPSQQTRSSASLLGFLFSLAPMAQLALGLSLLEFFVGASLWVDGQAGGSVAITGLGYLVVYDAIGVGIRVMGSIMRTGEGSQSSLRRPFGTHRIESLLYFVQSIFLLFACVYIAKESLEHVLLDGHHHGGDHEEEFDGIEFPTNLLLLGLIASLFASAKLQNHSVLVEVVGRELFERIGFQAAMARPRRKSRYLDSWLSIISNPFTLAVAGSNAVALVGSTVLSSHQLDTMDKALSMLEAALCFWIAYPASVAFGKVLLQTAPSGRSGQMMAFERAIKEISQHRLVIRVGQPHIWQLTPFQPNALAMDTPYASPSHSRRTSLADSRNTTPKTAQFPELRPPPYMPERRRSSSAVSMAAMMDKDPARKVTTTGCILVATLTVHVEEDADDAAVLEITRFAYERCAAAMGLASSAGMGRSSSEFEQGGELTVAVKKGLREEPGRHDHAAEAGEQGHGCQKQHDHGHDHGHDHDHKDYGHRHHDQHHGHSHHNHKHE